jgi:hypothetical protein
MFFLVIYHMCIDFGYFDILFIIHIIFVSSILCKNDKFYVLYFIVYFSFYALPMQKIL